MKKLLGAVFVLAGLATAHAQDFAWPVSGTNTQGFYGTFSGQGAGTWYDETNQSHTFAGTPATGTKMHRAIDISCVTGTPVKAARAGTVSTYGSTSHFYGYYAIVSHGSGYYTLYAHLSSFAVSSGASVSAGQVIAYSGATGNVTGPHLHFEIRHSASSTAYAAEAHYLPNGTITAGGAIPFDYPGIGGSSPPPMPVIVSPAGGATVAPGGLTLDWSDVTGADYYYVAVYKSGTLVQQAWPTASSTTSNVSAGSYTWHVYAHNGAGYGAGASSSFSVAGATPPPAPVIYAPSGGAVLSSSTVTLDWSTVSGADYYFVAVYASGVLAQQAWPTASALTVTLPSGAYSWHVYAHNSSGYGPGATSSFSIAASAPPGTPSGLTPNNWISVSTSAVPLDWVDVSGASSYEVEILYWTGSSWATYYTYTPSSSAQTFWPQVHFTYYAWKVRAKNSTGAGSWSGWAYFYFNK